MAARYPMILDVTTLPIVIVGGGAVGRRKAAGLIDAGATAVAVVSPDLADGFPAVRHVAERYAARHLDGARLVFAATSDPIVNAAVVGDARAAGAFVCRADADDDAPGDVVTPAQFECGPVRVTVSAGSAALSAFVRDRLAERFDPRWAAMAGAMVSLRPLLRDRSGLSPAERTALLRRLAGEEAMGVLDVHGTDGLLAWLGLGSRREDD